MTRQILIRDIKVAIKKQLAKVYPNASYVMDGEVKKYPSFYIRTTNIQNDNIGLSHTDMFSMTLYLRVEYREASETTSVIELNSKLDEVGMNLVDILRKLNLYGKNYICHMTNNETIDNIRICDFYIILNTTYEKLKQQKMQTIESNEEIKQGV